MGDLAQTEPYFKRDGNWTVLNSIKSGTYEGAVNILNNLSGLGLDFGHFGAIGDYTFGFSFDKSLMPVGEFVAHLFAECANDGIAIRRSLNEMVLVSRPTTDVPEPASTAGLAWLGLTFFGAQLRKRLRDNTI